MKFRFKTPVYVKQFQCLGADCEDTCCQNWDIHYDKSHYDILAREASADPAEKTFFERHVRPLGHDEQNERNFAKLQFNEQGYCPYLEEDGLCHIHAEFGVHALSNVCALYPRVLSQFGEEIEIAGALSCPEMVRLCLGSKQHFLEQSVSAKMLPRPADFALARCIEPAGADDYARSFPLVRKTLMRLMQDDAYSIETRQYAMASLAQRLSAFYYRGAQVQPVRVENECARILTPQVLETLEDFCARYEVDEPISMVVVQSILQLRLQIAPHEKLATRIREIIKAYAAQLDAAEAGKTFDFAPLELWRVYQEKLEVVNQVFGARLESYFSRYILNCLYREWFVAMPDAFSYVQMLIIRLNLLKFLIASDPFIGELAAAVKMNRQRLDSATLARFEEEVVYLVYNFARAIDHNSPFLQLLYQAMSEQQMITIDYSLAFIKG